MNKNNIYGKSGREPISVFFAADDDYLPYLEVAVASLAEHASADEIYNIYVLSVHFSEDSLGAVRSMLRPNITVSLVDMSERLFGIHEQLQKRLRDYYSESIYYRLFIPSLFPNLRRAVYLDSDIVLCEDAAKLYRSELEGNIIGAVTDESVMSVPIFRKYVVDYVGVEQAERYINSGVLVIDLDAMREHRIEERFLEMLEGCNFPTVAPDQDYINFLCRGKIKYLDKCWNKHAIVGTEESVPSPSLVHFNMFNKPWHYYNVPYEALFWKYAALAGKAAELRAVRSSYNAKKRRADELGAERLLASCKQIIENEPSLLSLFGTVTA